MAAVKKSANIIIFLAALISFAVSLNLFRQSFGINSPWFALLAMFCVLGVAALGRGIFRLRPPRSFRTLRAWERQGHIYRRLGVPLFGVFLRNTPLRHLNAEVYIHRRDIDFSAIQIQLEMAEAAHLWAAFLLMAYIIYALAQTLWRVAIAFLVIELLLNVYPILHLRYTRNRLSEFAFKARKRCEQPLRSD
jgi:hypothetical protein